APEQARGERAEITGGDDQQSARPCVAMDGAQHLVGSLEVLDDVQHDDDIEGRTASVERVIGLPYDIQSPTAARRHGSGRQLDTAHLERCTRFVEEEPVRAADFEEPTVAGPGGSEIVEHPAELGDEDVTAALVVRVAVGLSTFEVALVVNTGRVE